MPIDLGQGGGQRPSRGARTPRPKRQAPTTRFTRTDTARVVDEPGGFAQAGALRAVGQSLSNFFPALDQFQQNDHIEQMHQIAAENTAEVQRIEAAVLQDPEAARDAYTSGDFSKFIPNDELRRRRVISNVFQTVVATSMADQDFEEGVLPALRDVPLDSDPHDVTLAFIKSQTQDADPIFAVAYGRRVALRAKKFEREFRKKRQEAMQAKAQRTSEVFIRDAMKNQDFPASPDGLLTMRKTVIGMQPVNAVNAVKIGFETTDTQLIQSAARGNTHALMMITNVKDPERDGLTIRELNPTEYSKTLIAYQAARRTANSKEHQDAFTELNERLTKTKIGKGAEGDTPDRLYNDLEALGNKFGRNERLYAGTLAKFAGVFKGAANTTIAVGAIGRNGQPTGSAKDVRKMIEAAARHALTEPLIQAGFARDAEEAELKQDAFVGRAGSSKDMRDNSSRVLTGSDDYDAVEKMFKTIQARRSNSTNGAARNSHLSPSANMLQTAMEHAQETGQDKRAIWEKWKPQEGEVVEPNAARTAYARARDSSGLDRDESSKFAQAKEAWDRMENSDLEVSGVIFDSIPDYDTGTSSAVKAMVQNEMDASAHLSRNDPGATLETIADLAIKSVRDRLGLASDPEGNQSVVISNAPAVGISPDSQIVPHTKITSGTLTRAREDMAAAGNEEVLALLGTDQVGVVHDRDTGLGEGLAVTRRLEDGTVTSIHAAPGDQFNVDNKDLGQFTSFFNVTVLENGVAVMTVPSPPEAGQSKRIYLSKNTFFSFNDTLQRWSLRYGEDGAGDRKTMAGIDKMSQARQEELKAIRAGRPRRTLRLALDEALRAKTAGVGAPAPTEATTPPITPEMRDAVLAEKSKVIMGAVARNTVTSANGRKFINASDWRNDGSPEDIQDFSSGMDELKDDDFKQGNVGDDRSTPFDDNFMERAPAFVREHEDFRPQLYSDATQKDWAGNGKDKGNPTIGIGFNTGRKDADELLRKVGSSLARVKNKELLTEEQAKELTVLAMQKELNFLRKTFKDVTMSQNQWIALTSLSYNSRKLIGPKLRALINAGDWEGAAEEIRTQSNKSKSPGLQIRRENEADLFQGFVN